MKTLCLVFSELKIHREKQRAGFLAFTRRETHAELYYLARSMVQLVPTNTAPNRIAFSDRCLPNNLAKLFFRRSPRGSFETRPCMLVNMAMYVALALNCQDYNILTHPPHLPRH